MSTQNKINQVKAKALNRGRQMVWEQSKIKRNGANSGINSMNIRGQIVMLFFPSFPCFLVLSFHFSFPTRLIRSATAWQTRMPCCLPNLGFLKRKIFICWAAKWGKKEATIGQTWRFTRQKIAAYLQSWLLHGNPMIKTYTVTDFNLQL